MTLAFIGVLAVMAAFAIVDDSSQRGPREGRSAFMHECIQKQTEARCLELRRWRNP